MRKGMGFSECNGLRPYTGVDFSHTTITKELISFSRANYALRKKKIITILIYRYAFVLFFNITKTMRMMYMLASQISCIKFQHKISIGPSLNIKLTV